MQHVIGNSTYNNTSVLAHAISAFGTNLIIGSCTSMRLLQLAEGEVDGRVKDHINALLFNLHKAKVELWVVSLWGTFWKVRQCLGRGKEKEVWGGNREWALVQELCPAKVSMWVLT